MNEFRTANESDRPDQTTGVGDPVHTKFQQECYNFLVDNFANLDKNNNGFVSKDELSAAQKDPAYQNKVEITSELLQNLPSISRLSGDGFGSDKKGISLDDMDRFNQIRQDLEMDLIRAQSLVTNLTTDFTRIDYDRDRVLSSQELLYARTPGASTAYNKIDEIGHVTGQEPYTIYVPVVVNGQVVMVPQTRWMNVYGIDQQDLNTYPARLYSDRRYGPVNRMGR